MREQNFYPKRNRKVAGPSRLADLNGRRAPGQFIMVGKPTKPPKRRFNIGDYFADEGTTWRIIYMFRLQKDQGVWYHCLEETKEVTEIGAAFVILGAGATTPRIVYEPFLNSSDAHQFFSDIYRNGSSKILDTQSLLKLRKL